MTFRGRRRIALCFPQDRSASHADGAVRCQPQKWCCFSVSKSFCSIKQGLLGRFYLPCTWPTFSVKTIRTQSSGLPPGAKTSALSLAQPVSPGNICEGGCSVTHLSISQTGRERPAGLTSSRPQRGGPGKRTGRPGLSPGHRGLR